MTTLKPRTAVDRALLALFDRDLEAVRDHPERVGGDPYATRIDDLYIEIATVPGGSHDQLQGDTVIDIDVYATDYSRAESVAFAAEALLLGYPHVVNVGDRKVVLDRVTQNVGPAERPWEDDSITRIGATYVITTRRP